MALYFNRNIGADIRIVPMEGYQRSMIYQDTNLPWIATSPNIPDLDSVFGYQATGLGGRILVFFKQINLNGLVVKVLIRKNMLVYLREQV